MIVYRDRSYGRLSLDLVCMEPFCRLCRACMQVQLYPSSLTIITGPVQSHWLVSSKGAHPAQLSLVYSWMDWRDTSKPFAPTLALACKMARWFPSSCMLMTLHYSHHPWRTCNACSLLCTPSVTLLAFSLVLRNLPA